MLTLEIELQPGGCQRRTHTLANKCTRISTCIYVVPGTFLLAEDLVLMEYRPPFLQRSYLIGTGAICTRHRRGLERVPRAAVGAARKFAFETERVCSPDASSRHEIYIFLSLALICSRTTRNLTGYQDSFVACILYPEPQYLHVFTLDTDA